MLSTAEYKIWHKQQQANTRIKRNRKKTKWSDRNLRKEANKVKHGYFKFRSKLPGSFESNSR